MIQQLPIEQENQLVERARSGDEHALDDLIQPLRRPLFSYIYRMVTHPHDAEDLLQEVLVRVMQSLPRYKSESRFNTWLFGIATHVCLDHLRSKKRWRVEAQLYGEREAVADPSRIEGLRSLMHSPDFVFEMREHIAHCFSCISRTLEPELQAALMLREVLGFSNQEAATMLEISEPVFRHRLSDARAKMTSSYEGLCQLINKTGACWQCSSLNEMAGPAHQGELVRIEVAGGVPITPDNLFEARLEIVRKAQFPYSKTRPMHDVFLEGLNRREESAPDPPAEGAR
jgi:RNA polymerase sigma-70 factor (ECF subfamily)